MVSLQHTVQSLPNHIEGFYIDFLLLQQQITIRQQLKTTQFLYLIILGVRSSKWVSWTKVKVLAELCSFPGALGDTLFLPLQFLEATHILWPMAFSPTSKLAMVKPLSHLIILTLSLLPPSSTFKEACDYIGPIKDNSYFKLS